LKSLVFLKNSCGTNWIATLVIHKEDNHLLIPVAFVDIYANFGWFNAIFESLGCLHVFEKLHGAKRRI
jgi:hypothetical protein